MAGAWFVPPEKRTRTRHLSWSVNIFYNFIHSFIHSFGGVRISWQFVRILNRGFGEP